MADYKGFMMYFDKIGAIEHLTREENGELFEAIVTYAKDDKIVNFDSRVVEAVFYTIKPALDDDKEKYDEICQKRAESGKKGGRPKKEESESQANAFSEEEEKAKKANGFSENQTVFEKSKKSQNQKQNQNQNQNYFGDTDVSLSTGVDAPAGSAPGKVTAKQVVDLFNTICVSYPRVTVLSEKRRKAINARLKSMGYSLDAFRVLFEKAEMSDFLKGRNNKDWRATFDWLIKDGNMAKVLDGNYDNRPAGGFVGGNGETIPSWAKGMAEWAAKGETGNNNDPMGFLSG